MCKNFSIFFPKQFEESILDTCMYLLDKSKLKMSSRRDPVVVSRAMSALVWFSLSRSDLPLLLSLLLLACYFFLGDLNTISG